METACCIMQNLLELLPEMKKNNIGETDAAVCYPILSREMHVDLSGEHSSLLLSLALWDLSGKLAERKHDDEV